MDPSYKSGNNLQEVPLKSPTPQEDLPAWISIANGNPAILITQGPEMFTVL
jgi:hypothetical protein